MIKNFKDYEKMMNSAIDTAKEICKEVYPDHNVEYPVKFSSTLISAVANCSSYGTSRSGFYNICIHYGGDLYLADLSEEDKFKTAVNTFIHETLHAITFYENNYTYDCDGHSGYWAVLANIFNDSKYCDIYGKIERYAHYKCKKFTATDILEARNANFGLYCPNCKRVSNKTYVNTPKYSFSCGKCGYDLEIFDSFMAKEIDLKLTEEKTEEKTEENTNTILNKLDDNDVKEISKELSEKYNIDYNEVLAVATEFNTATNHRQYNLECFKVLNRYCEKYSDPKYPASGIWLYKPYYKYIKDLLESFWFKSDNKKYDRKYSNKVYKIYSYLICTIYEIINN